MVGVVRFHPDSKRLLLLTSASIDCSIRVWDLSSSRCVHVLSGHVSAVTALAIPVDGSIFLSSGRDQVVHVWDLEGGSAKKTIPVFESVEGLILLPDTLSVISGPIKQALRARRKAGVGQSGLLFATAGDKGVIRVWSSESSGPPCLTSCGRLDKDSAASSSSKPEQTTSEGGRREGKGEGEERERDLARVYTSLHLCEELGTLCGVTHDHNFVLFDLPQLSLRKQDVSEAVEEEEQLKREEQILREQELSNLLHHGDYLRAVGVAISLDQPFRVLKILQELLDEGGLDGKFKDTILSLREDQIYSILRYASRWNTNAHHCPVAQSVLSVVLRSQPPEKMMEMEDIKLMVEGLLPYTERHYQRMARLQQLSSFVEYTWQCMKLPSSSSQQLLAVDGLGGEELGGPSHHQQHTAPLSPVMAAADSTTQAEHDEVAMATEGQLTVEGGGGDSASDDEASGDDDHTITSSTSSSRVKTKGSRKEKLKSRLKKLKNRKTKLYHLSGYKKDRTIKLKKK